MNNPVDLFSSLLRRPILSDSPQIVVSSLLSNKIEGVGEEDGGREGDHPLDDVEGEHHPPEPLLARLDTLWLVLAHLAAEKYNFTI